MLISHTIVQKQKETDKLVRCDVIVDKINSIRIKHTTTHLYLEDSPESFTVEAFDDEVAHANKQHHFRTSNQN